MSNFISRASIEHLVCKLPSGVIESIEKVVQKHEGESPGYCNRIVADAIDWRDRPLSEPGSRDANSRDIKVNCEVPARGSIFHLSGLSGGWRPPEEESSATIPHIVVRTTSREMGAYASKTDAIIIPLAYILVGMECMVLNPDRYQVYQHNFMSTIEWHKAEKNLIKKLKKRQLSLSDLQNLGKIIPLKLEGSSKKYIGLTSRSWQVRFAEHLTKSRNDSHLLFHRALRGGAEYNDYKLHTEHIVLRAGLTSQEADRFEESAVDEVSWVKKHKHGLNMIPGGKAGYKHLVECGLPAGAVKRPKVRTPPFSEYTEDVLSRLSKSSLNRVMNKLADDQIRTFETLAPALSAEPDGPRDEPPVLRAEPDGTRPEPPVLSAESAEPNAELPKPPTTSYGSARHAPKWHSLVDNVREVECVLQAARDFNESLKLGATPDPIIITAACYKPSVDPVWLDKKREWLDKKIEEINLSKHYVINGLVLKPVKGLYLGDKSVIEVWHQSCGTRSYVFLDNLLRIHLNEDVSTRTACCKRNCFEEITGTKLAKGSITPSRAGQKPINAKLLEDVAQIVADQSSGVLAMVSSSYKDVRQPFHVKISFKGSKYDGKYILIAHSNAVRRDQYRKYSDIVRENSTFHYSVRLCHSIDMDETGGVRISVCEPVVHC